MSRTTLPFQRPNTVNIVGSQRETVDMFVFSASDIRMFAVHVGWV